MAPFNYENALAIGDAATRMQAQADGLDNYIATSQALADKFGTPMFYKGLNQTGGRHKHSRRCTHRKQRGGPYRQRSGGSYRQRSGGSYRQQRGGSCRQQRGGNWQELQQFSAPYTYLPAGTPTGVNPQFMDEGKANVLYAENRGAQY